uniref:Uncharacterized protein n=1 Tax=Cannabis sativa TaxID=3483 RepID=A0A803PHW1_CANSA
MLYCNCIGIVNEHHELLPCIMKTPSLVLVFCPPQTRIDTSARSTIPPSSSLTKAVGTGARDGVDISGRRLTFQLGTGFACSAASVNKS